MSAEDFKRLWATAKVVQPTDPLLTSYSYSPWITGTFSGPDGNYSFDIYLGGLGRLRTPGDLTVHFLVDARAISP